MRKLIFAFLGVLTLYSCNKKEIIEIKKKSICDTYRSIPQDRPELRYGFLMAIKNDYCTGNFDPCILENHAINTATYNGRLAECPSNKPYGMSVKDLKKNFLNGSCLDDYISFEIDSTTYSVTKLKSVKYDASIENKYSIPMFKAIIKNYNLKDTDTINFVCGKNNLKTEVMFNYPNNVSGGVNVGNVTMDPSFKLDIKKLKELFEKSNIEYIYRE